MTHSTESAVCAVCAVYALPPKAGFVLTHFLMMADVSRSAEFYARARGADRPQG